MEDPGTKSIAQLALKELHFDVQSWKSELQYAEDDLLFMNKLIQSNAFRQDTHNLFERLEGYKVKLKEISDTKKQLQASIVTYENRLGYMMGQKLADYDPNYLEKHHVLRDRVMDYRSSFKELKSELFNYAGGILK